MVRVGVSVKVGLRVSGCARQLIDLIGMAAAVDVKQALFNQAVVPDRVELRVEKYGEKAADMYVRDLVGLGKGHHSEARRGIDEASSAGGGI